MDRLPTLKNRVAAGARLRAAGRWHPEPRKFVSGNLKERSSIALFDKTIYLSKMFQTPDLGFMVAFVTQTEPIESPVYARLYYKDLSLIWRAASHVIHGDGELWVGKGALVPVEVDGEICDCSNESTTDLPLEIQGALEAASRVQKPTNTGEDVILRVLQRGGRNRLEPFSDFTKPRTEAAARPGGLINGGRPVATFKKENDPSSLRFVSGYEPDLVRGIVEAEVSRSRFYGGDIKRYRILSKNKTIQYGFMAGPKHTWIIPPQALTTELSTFGLRVVDVDVDEHLCVPGYEYHFIDEEQDPPAFHSQIPDGYAGAPNEIDPDRADASAWLDALPIIQAFKKRGLGW